MITLSEDQITQKRDSLPENLLEALCDEKTSETIWSVAETEKIPDERIYTISGVASWVLMGFLHPEDLAKELQDQMGLDSQVATRIQAALNTKIFLPLKPDIDKVYKPVGAMAPQPTIIATSPVASGQTMKDIVQTPPVTPLPPAPPKAPLGEKGWSKLPASAIAPLPPTPKTPIPTPVVSAPVAPIVPNTTPAPAPVMIQGNASAMAAQKNIDFHLSRPGSGSEVSLEGSKPKPAPMAAVIEFGNKSNSVPKAPVAPTGAIHYTEFQTSPMPMPAASSVARKITEITTPVPTAPIAPMPPTPPTPPKPPEPPKPKVIVQNFP